MIDFEVHPALNFRGGIILSPLGRFNLAHDSPANELTDRPLVSTAALSAGEAALLLTVLLLSLLALLTVLLVALVTHSLSS